MKKGILSLTLSLLLLQSFSQLGVSPVLTKSDYLLKSKHQKTAAWILLGGGLAATVLGFAIASTQVLIRNSNSGNGATILALTGVGAMVGNIPLFISSGKNRRRAGALSFTNQKVLSPHQNTTSLHMQPALTLKIPLL